MPLALIRLFQAVPLAVTLAACASSTPAASGELAPRMFSADELRAALPQGTELRYRFEQPNTPVVVERWVFATTTATIAVIETERFSEDGTSLGQKERGASSWVQLMEHGSFPADKTTIEDAELEAAVGKKQCRLYRVQAADDKGEAITRMFYFAKDWPGPPIRFETWKNGERIFLGEMVERKIPQ
jgi:hypothetical protein